MTSMFVQLSPTFNRDQDAAQYVTTFPDSTDIASFGIRYVFAYIKTRTLSLDTRINGTFSPNLTLQLFVQPFIASGAYSSFREFAAPRSVKKMVYGTDVGTIVKRRGRVGCRERRRRTRWIRMVRDRHLLFLFADPDFTTRSLRGSAVLKCEYRPGSTVYFVWTQQGAGFDPAGDFDFGSAAAAVFRDKAVNLFQVKVSYWIGR
jgi:hypothetical protein